jgi:hypothetical protein
MASDGASARVSAVIDVIWGRDGSVCVPEMPDRLEINPVNSQPYWTTAHARL